MKYTAKTKIWEVKLQRPCVIRGLANMGIETLGDLSKKSAHFIASRAHNVGKGSIEELRTVLKKAGLDFAPRICHFCGSKIQDA